MQTKIIISAYDEETVDYAVKNVAERSDDTLIIESLGKGLENQGFFKIILDEGAGECTEMGVFKIEDLEIAIKKFRAGEK